MEPRLETGHAWAEEPASRFRHFTTNVRAAGEINSSTAAVKSNVLLYRSRGDTPEHDLLAGVLDDRFRCIDDEWRLAERTVYLDHTVVTSYNLSTLF